MTIEYLLALEDGTWTTERIDVGSKVKPLDHAAAIAYAHKHLAGQAQYRKVALFAVYDWPAECDHDCGNQERSTCRGCGEKL